MIPIEIARLLQSLPAADRRQVESYFNALEVRLALQAEASLKQKQQIEMLSDRLDQLEHQLKQNSKNSHKPPSSDGFKKPKRTRSLRKKSNRKPGGQAGHPGSKLKRSDDIDKFVFHPVNTCKCCGKDLKGVEIVDYVKRQVFDLPDLSLDVIEHQAELKQCSCGAISQGVFPDDVRGEVQYGPGIRGLASYLQNYQLLPYQRSAQLLRDVFEVSISEGTLYNISEQAYDELEDFESQLKQYLIKQDVLHSDETGVNVGGKTHWLHSASNGEYTHYQVHPGRGYEAMNEIGILPFFKGTLVHDCLRSYFRYEQAEHSVCLAHILRELQAQVEQKQGWAEQMLQLILALKKSKDRAIDQGKTQVSQATIKDYQKQYHQILQRGNRANPLPPKDYNNPRKRKRTKAQNLLRRLEEYESEVFRFYTDFNVPFDNNLAERDLRMAKVKQKISGCFRSERGAHYFARLRSYISSARKQGLNTLEALKAIFDPMAEPIFQFNAELAR
jgi:transposase